MAEASQPTVSATSVAMGNNITITTNRKNNSYTHNLTYAIGSSTGTIKNGVGASCKWTVPLNLAKAIPSAKKGTVTVTCKTFDNNGNSIGTKTVSFTATVPNNSTTQPSFTVSTAQVYIIDNLADKFKGLYIQGISKVKVTTTASSTYSEIASYKTEILGQTGNGYIYTSDILNTSGNVEIKITVTDKRGYSTKKTTNINVIPYSLPRIVNVAGQSKIICARGKDDGSISPSGECLVIKVGRHYGKIMSNGQLNFCSLSCEYKEESSNSYTTVELLSKTATDDYVSKIITGFDKKTVYDIRLIAEDDVGKKTTVTYTLPTVFATYHAPKGGHGFTLGGYHDSSKYDFFDCRFEAEFQRGSRFIGDSIFEGNVRGMAYGLGRLPSIPENADLNNYTNIGMYGIYRNATAKTLLNCPCEWAGTLRVWASNGEIANDNGYVYLLQEYTRYDTGEVYRRFMSRTPSPDFSWTIGDWKLMMQATQ